MKSFTEADLDILETKATDVILKKLSLTPEQLKLEREATDLYNSALELLVENSKIKISPQDAKEIIGRLRVQVIMAVLAEFSPAQIFKMAMPAAGVALFDVCKPTREDVWGPLQ